jgi:biopolymer transport protein ExbB/biopolymer transport protein TolQ
MGLFARLIVIAMGVMSVASLVVLAERLVVFRRSRSESRAFAEKMGAILAKGDLVTAANTNLGKNVGHLGRVIGAGLTAYRLSPNNRDLQVESVARALERQSQREVQSLKRGLGLLATVGSTAPFVGLLGTVMGIVNSFKTMAATGSGGIGTVSAGIACRAGWTPARWTSPSRRTSSSTSSPSSSAAPPTKSARKPPARSPGLPLAVPS